jgi:hypothetical protein
MASQGELYIEAKHICDFLQRKYSSELVYLVAEILAARVTWPKS